MIEACADCGTPTRIRITSHSLIVDAATGARHVCPQPTVQARECVCGGLVNIVEVAGKETERYDADTRQVHAHRPRELWPGLSPVKAEAVREKLEEITPVLKAAPRKPSAADLGGFQ